MTRPDEAAIRRLLTDRVTARLQVLETFAEIDSTNSYLMQAPPPRPGSLRVALTDNQTQGRGRHGRTWVSPPGSGLCLSMACTYATPPPDLPALTLAIGLGIIDALEGMDITGIRLKWPNDLVAGDGKLGGILTETQAASSGAVTVVTGVGINVDLGASFACDEAADGALRAVDLAGHAGAPPRRDEIAAALINALSDVFGEFEAAGFSTFAARWPGRDWLLGKAVTIDAPQGSMTGTAAGIDTDGALLVDTGAAGLQRVTSGSVVAARAQGVPA